MNFTQQVTAEKEEKDFKNQLSTHLCQHQGRSVEGGVKSEVQENGKARSNMAWGNTVKNTFHTNNSNSPAEKRRRGEPRHRTSLPACQPS